MIDNKEWNAFAMGNYSIYVFSGLLKDLDDDEVAIVLGHEMVHATHEHTRRQFKKQMWIQLAALGLAGVEEATIDNEKARVVAQLATVFAATAVSSGYGRDLEDQADRVGLRYAYEAGYDMSKGPRLWNRFAKKYGEEGKVANFFFSDHSLSSARASNLEKQIALNYPEGPKKVARARPATTGGTATTRRRDRGPAAPRPRPVQGPHERDARGRGLREQGDQAGHEPFRRPAIARGAAGAAQLRQPDEVGLSQPVRDLRGRQGQGSAVLHRRPGPSGPDHASSHPVRTEEQPPVVRRCRPRIRSQEGSFPFLVISSLVPSGGGGDRAGLDFLPFCDIVQS